MRILALIVLSLIGAGLAGDLRAEEPMETAPSEAAEETTPKPEQPETPAEDDSEATGEPSPGVMAHTGRLATNFWRLLTRSGGDLLTFAGHLLLGCVLWGLLFAGIGLVLGILLWRWLRRLKLFDTSWRWYAYARWLWAVVFFLIPLAGAGYAGLAYGGGRCVNYYIEERRALDRIAANLICAIALDEAEYELKGNETTEDYVKALNDSRELKAAVDADFQNMVDQLAELGPDHPLKGTVMGIMVAKVLASLSGVLHGVDVRALAVVLLQHRNLDDYLATQEQTPKALVLFASQMGALRRESVRMVNVTVYSHAVIATLAGFGLPLVLLALFRLLVWMTGGNRPTSAAPAAPAPPPAPAPEIASAQTPPPPPQPPGSIC